MEQQTNKEILLTDLPSLVKEQSSLTKSAEYDKWLTVPYETGDFCGQALVAMNNFTPPKVEIALNVKGWHKIFFGVIGLRGKSGIGVQLGDGGKTIIETRTRIMNWQPSEWIDEGFFRAMDLTGKNLQLTKYHCPGIPTSSALAYVRLVPMTDEEVRAYTQTNGGCVAFHYDNDVAYDADYETVQEWTGRLEMLENTHGGDLYLEHSFGDSYAEEPTNHVYFSEVDKTFARRLLKWNKDKAVRQYVLQKATDLGLTKYATYRMEVADFCFPYGNFALNDGVAKLHPECWCKTRDNRDLEIMSYAYPTTRRIVIDRLMRALDEGFDGLALVYHRGLHVAFEQPVLDRVQELYGVDARKLPFADERLHGVLCEAMTTFMRELKAEVTAKYGDSKKISVIVYYDPVSSKNFGLDTETWCKENLIDCVCQGIMTHYENLDGCLGDDGLIDLEKYKKVNSQRQVLCRIYSGEADLILDTAKAFKVLCDKYGKSFRATFMWEGDDPYSSYLLSQDLKKHGINQFISWNANHKAKDLYYLNLERAIARGETDEHVEHRFVRVLSIAGKDISSFCQNWRG